MSFTPAKFITSPQADIHKNLDAVVYKHLHHPHLKPIADHTKAAFDKAYTQWQHRGCPNWVLDSGCGTGESSHHWASVYPDHLVIGIDRSLKRLNNSNNQNLPENCVLLRCDCADFWQLAEQAQWQASFHSLLYPNPYPKPQHLQRRWHGNGAFACLLAISKQQELRTNWAIYAKEFYRALELAQESQLLHAKVVLQSYNSKTPITAFERKYIASGHRLWQVTINSV